jgi:hypothetical protein
VINEESSRVMRDQASYMLKRRTGAVADCPPLIVRHCLDRSVAVARRYLVEYGTGRGRKHAQVGKIGAASRVAKFPCGVLALKNASVASCLEVINISQHEAAWSTVYAT